MPNIIAPLLVPLIAQKIGKRSTLTIYTILMTVGMFIQFFGAKNLDFDILLLGIALYGIGVNGCMVLISNNCNNDKLYFFSWH